MKMQISAVVLNTANPNGVSDTIKKRAEEALSRGFKCDVEITEVKPCVPKIQATDDAENDKVYNEGVLKGVIDEYQIVLISGNTFPLHALHHLVNVVKAKRAEQPNFPMQVYTIVCNENKEFVRLSHLI